MTPLRETSIFREAIRIQDNLVGLLVSRLLFGAVELVVLHQDGGGKSSWCDGPVLIRNNLHPHQQCLKTLPSVGRHNDWRVGKNFVDRTVLYCNSGTLLKRLEHSLETAIGADADLVHRIKPILFYSSDCICGETTEAEGSSEIRNTYHHCLSSWEFECVRVETMRTIIAIYRFRRQPEK